MATPEFRKIILIGLGGTGQNIVLNLKRMFMDTYNVVPPSVKLLCLDTDTATANAKVQSQLSDRTYSLDPQEFLYMRVDQPQDFIKTKTVQEWFVSTGAVSSIVNGAGAVRQNGRLALFHHLNEVQRRLTVLQNVLNDMDLHRQMASAKAKLGSRTDFVLSGRKAEIYICGSLAGGTGSGSFLDMGIILRQRFSDALIHGFFLLDWLFRENAFSYRVGGNVYAALCELDNLESVGAEGFLPYQVDYGQGPVKVTLPPYTLFHLIDGRNEAGENLADPKEIAEIVARSIFLSIGAMGDRITSVVDNLSNLIASANPKLWDGKFARYSSLGVSSIFYPAPQYARRLIAESAAKLCEEARREATEGASKKKSTVAPPEVSQNVERILTQLGYPGKLVEGLLRARGVTPPVMPAPPRESLSLKDFTTAMSNKLANREKTMQSAFESAWQGVRSKAVAEKIDTLRRSLDAIEKDPNLTAARKAQHRERLVATLSGYSDVLAEEKRQKGAEVANLRQAAEQALTTAGQASAGFLGGNRKPLAETWAQSATRLLVGMYELNILEREGALIGDLLAAIEARPALAMPASSRIADLLGAARNILVRMEQNAAREINDIKHHPTDIVLGGGAVFFPTELIERLASTGEAKSQPGQAPEIALRYDLFKDDAGIHVPDDYVSGERDSAEKLAQLFLDYAHKRLAPMADLSVHTALQTCASMSGVEPREYIREQFHHLFRLASPLWRFSQERLDPTRSPRYDKIVNVGVDDEQACRILYEDLVSEAKTQFRVLSPHSFTTTGDPTRIWLLNYAAALPAYFLQSAEESRTPYLDAMSPPYHLDSRLEMNLPDLFPSGASDNVALRVLGMAIVPDIDLIKDRKLGPGQGHEFTLTDPELLKRCYDDQPQTWHLFRDLYAEMCPSRYVDQMGPSGTNRGAELLDALKSRLAERVKSIPKDDSSPLRLEDVRDPTKLAQRLRTFVLENQQLQQHANAFSPGLAERLKAYKDGTPTEKDLQDLMLQLLNGLIKATLVEDLEIARAFRFSDELGRALRDKPPLGERRTCLNRRLLQELLDDAAARDPLRRSLLCRSLRTAVEQHVAHVREKLDSRGFNRLLSARLTYQEITALEDFLRPVNQGGYGLDIDRYLGVRG